MIISSLYVNIIIIMYNYYVHFCYHDKFIILKSTKIFVCTYFDESVHWVTVHTRIIESLITCEIFVSTFRVCHVLLSRVRKYHVLVWLSVGQYVRAYKCDLVLQSSKVYPKVCFSKRVFCFITLRGKIGRKIALRTNQNWEGERLKRDPRVWVKLFSRLKH